MISVITPVYNEAAQIKESVRRLRERLSADFDEPWELIVVNDGSTDDSLKLIHEAAEGDERVRVVSYGVNRGRGYALRQGFAEAKGDILVTTESDLTWGEDIAKRMVDVLRARPDTSFVLASPHLDGGGYECVPPHRVLLSRYGNILLRWIFSGRVTMTTGMTRCYKREVIDSMLLISDGKEIHLEILSKALVLGYVPTEIPAVVRWPEARSSRPATARDRLHLLRLTMSHLIFGIAERPHAFLGTVGLLLLAFGGLFGLVDVAWMLSGPDPVTSKPTINPPLIGVLITVGLVVLVFDFLALQNRANQKELIVMQREMLRLRREQEHRSERKE